MIVMREILNVKQTQVHPGDPSYGWKWKAFLDDLPDRASAALGYWLLADNSPVSARMLFPGRASTVLEVGALSDLDNISVRIADVAARLAVLGDRCRDELRSSAFP
jgi:hypothetical protein